MRDQITQTTLGSEGKDSSFSGPPKPDLVQERRNDDSTVRRGSVGGPTYRRSSRPPGVLIDRVQDESRWWVRKGTPKRGNGPRERPCSMLRTISKGVGEERMSKLNMFCYVRKRPTHPKILYRSFSFCPVVSLCVPFQG